MAYNNVWLSLKRARMIVQDLMDEYKGMAVHEDYIIESLWNHPLYEDHMWLDVDWSGNDTVVDIHVGVLGGIII